jgi:hypothetical protein
VSLARYLWFTLLWAVFTLPFLSRLVIGRTSHDVELFWVGGSAVLQGAGIYSDVVFEYPPYALLWFVGPAAMATDLAEFRLAFGLLIWAIDASVKGYLLWHALRPGWRARDFVPLGYTRAPPLLVTPATALRRHSRGLVDGGPAALAVGPRRPAWSLSASARRSIRLYVPVMAVYAFAEPVLISVALSSGRCDPVLPRSVDAMVAFCDVHAGRGLQVESAWASVV